MQPPVEVPQFAVVVQRFTVLREIPGSRTAAHYLAMLEAMEFGDPGTEDPAELRELCLMALQDRPPDEAADVVLSHDLGGLLKPGQLANLAHEMVEEKLWEEYSDLGLHERLFTVGALLWAAFPATFPEPDAVQVRVAVVGENDAARALLAAPLAESLVVRLLADGMGERAILHRLFEDQLAGSSFPEADTIVWIVEATRDGEAVVLDVISSGYWLDALRETRAYSSTARPDAPPADH